MRRRTAGKTSSEFWGCSAYPNCKGTRDIEP
jgi:ssDNA-binding Zn-finger/Zn-ribbon topoisomerase 1